MDSYRLKAKILLSLERSQAPLPLSLLPGYSKDTDRALSELVAQGVVVVGPMIPHRTWALPQFVKNLPKGVL